MTALLCYAGAPNKPVHAQAAGCAALESGTVTVVGSTTTVRPAEAPCVATTAQITAARNEFESFQIVVKAAGTQLNTVNVAAGALTGPGGATIAAGNITIYREGLYNVTTPSDGEGAVGEWPDALIPKVDPWYGQTRNAFPVNVPASQNRVAWIDVFVPKTATPGNYSGIVTVSSAGGSVQVPVALKVLNITLPSTSTLQSSFSTSWKAPCAAHTGDLYCNWDETQRWSLHALYAQAALDNRVTISNPMPMGVNVGPSAAETAQFKTHILPLLRPDVAPFHNKWAAPRLQGAEMTSLNLHWNCGTNCLTTWKNLAVTAPTFNDKVFLYCVDEPGATVAMWDTCRNSRNNAATAWPGLPLLVTATIQDTTAAGMDTAINIITPVVNRMHDKDYANSCCRGNQRAKYDAFLNLAGNRLWMYTSNMSFSSDDIPNQYWDGWPGYAIDQPASQSRAMGWLSFTYNSTGELYWETTQRLSTAWAPSGLYEQGGNGDGTLFYPGTPAAIGGTTHIPVESIRLKRIRDGREDFEYLNLLAKAGKRADAVTIATQLFPSMYQTTVTQAALDTARAALIAKLEPAATATPPAAPVLVGPTGNDTDGGWIIWQSSAGATSYTAWVDDSTGHLGTWTYNADQTCYLMNGQCEMPMPELAAGEVRFWVKATNSAGSSPWSAGMTWLKLSETPKAQILSSYPVPETAGGGSAKLWSRVRNVSVGALPATAKVWFLVTDPAGKSTWVGSASAAGLAPRADSWYSTNWIVPAGSPAGTYTFWSQVFSPDSTAISGWSPAQTFNVAGSAKMEITSVYPVGTVARGASATLWAKVANRGTSVPPAGTKVWFWVNGPNWSGSNWVGGTVIGSLAAGGEQWYAIQWTVPATATPGGYAYWAQVWSATGAITPWSAGQAFTVK